MQQGYGVTNPVEVLLRAATLAVLVRDPASCRPGYRDRSSGPAAGTSQRVNPTDCPRRLVARSAVSSSTSAAEVTRLAWPVRSN